MSRETFTAKDVENYYDHSRVHYARIWNLEKSRSIHYGYWDSSTKTLHEALVNINNILSKKAAITKADRVLDAGCGIGGSSLWLAKNIGCTVTGISLSTRQIAEAQLIASKENLQRSATFTKNDFTNTGYAAGSFDVIWAIESVCHAPEKGDFIREAFRLLKSGGRLILADFFEAEKMNAAERKIMTKWANGWAIEKFSSLPEFTNKLKEAGFQKVIDEDITPHIVRSAKRLYYAYFPGAIAGFIYRIFHPRATAFGKKNIDTAFLQYKGLKKKLWTYNIFLAVKP